MRRAKYGLDTIKKFLLVRNNSNQSIKDFWGILLYDDTFHLIESRNSIIKKMKEKETISK